MPKPSEQELHIALETAKQMREHGQDPHYLAKCLLNTHYRLKQVEKVMSAVEQYLHSGLAEAEHRRLLVALQQAHEADARSAAQHPPEWGLS